MVKKMKQQPKQKSMLPILLVICYLMFLGVSFMIDFEPGKQISMNFVSFAYSMLTVLPIAFVLISLFEVWVKRESVEKHLGEESGLKGYIWAILLAGTTIGPFYATLPIAHSLGKKGAALGVLFTYISASAICRIPMATFEASFLGLKFTAIRLLVSLPLVVLTSMLLGKYLTTLNYAIQEEG
jgi:uncharacterized membrane protein YraQ (UPF0718 family)